MVRYKQTYTAEQLQAMDPMSAPPPHDMSPAEMRKLAEQNEEKRRKEKEKVKHDVGEKKDPDEVPNSPEDLGYSKDVKTDKKTDSKKGLKKQVEEQNEKFLGDLNRTTRLMVPFAEKEQLDELMTPTNHRGVITVNTFVVKEMAEVAGKLVLKPEAEVELVKLMELKDLIDNTFERVKEAISKAGETIMPGFTGVLGEKIKCTYRVYGGKYQIIDQQMAQNFVISKPKYEIDTKKVDAYVKEHGELPEGIGERERAKVLSVSLKDEITKTD